MCTPYFVNLNNNTFQVKLLVFFVHLCSQQKRTEKVILLLNLQCCHFDIVILRVAIVSDVQNVRLQRRHRPTPDRQQLHSSMAWFTTDCPVNNDTFITPLATLSLSNR